MMIGKTPPNVVAVSTAAAINSSSSSPSPEDTPPKRLSIGRFLLGAATGVQQRRRSSSTASSSNLKKVPPPPPLPPASASSNVLSDHAILCLTRDTSDDGDGSTIGELQSEEFRFISSSSSNSPMAPVGRKGNSSTPTTTTQPRRSSYSKQQCRRPLGAQRRGRRRNSSKSKNRTRHFRRSTAATGSSDDDLDSSSSDIDINMDDDWGISSSLEFTKVYNEYDEEVENDDEQVENEEEEEQQQHTNEQKLSASSVPMRTMATPSSPPPYPIESPTKSIDLAGRIVVASSATTTPHNTVLPPPPFLTIQQQQQQDEKISCHPNIEEATTTPNIYYNTYIEQEEEVLPQMIQEKKKKNKEEKDDEKKNNKSQEEEENHPTTTTTNSIKTPTSLLDSEISCQKMAPIVAATSTTSAGTALAFEDSDDMAKLSPAAQQPHALRRRSQSERITTSTRPSSRYSMFRTRFRKPTTTILDRTQSERTVRGEVNDKQQQQNQQVDTPGAVAVGRGRGGDTMSDHESFISREDWDLSGAFSIVSEKSTTNNDGGVAGVAGTATSITHHPNYHHRKSGTIATLAVDAHEVSLVTADMVTDYEAIEEERQALQRRIEEMEAQARQVVTAEIVTSTQQQPQPDYVNNDDPLFMSRGSMGNDRNISLSELSQTTQTTRNSGRRHRGGSSSSIGNESGRFLGTLSHLFGSGGDGGGRTSSGGGGVSINSTTASSSRSLSLRNTSTQSNSRTLEEEGRQQGGDGDDHNDDVSEDLPTMESNHNKENYEEDEDNKLYCCNYCSLGCAILLVIAGLVGIIMMVIIILLITTTGSTTSDVIDTKPISPTDGPPIFENDETSIPSPPIGDGDVLLPSTLEIIKTRGWIKCRGESFEVQQGFGFSIDMCRAMAAAILGDPDKVEFPYIPFREQWTHIANGTMDLSTTQTTHNMNRDVRESRTGKGFIFSTPFLYSGTSFAGIPEFVDCADQGETLLGTCRDLSVCVIASTVTQELVEEHLDGSNTHLVEVSGELFEQFSQGNCNVIAGAPQLIYEDRVRQVGYTGPYVFGPRIYAKEPLALVSRGGDPEFGDLVNWVLQALIAADAMNISRDTAHLFPTTDLWGEENKEIFQRAIAAVGNYGDLYSKWLEDRVPRQGLNSINTRGTSGLMYSSPFGNTMIDDTDWDLDAEDVSGPMVNGTMERIAIRGVLYCGIVSGRPGLAEWNATSAQWTGLDVDYCYGLSAALFAGDVDQVIFFEVDTMQDGFVSLQNGDVDVLAGALYNMETDVRELTTGVGFTFGPIYFFNQSMPTEDTNETIVTSAHALATRQVDGDEQWSDFVQWITYSTIHAEEYGMSAVDMPVVELFGNLYRQSIRDVILAIGSYDQLYQRNMERYVLRGGRNLLNTGGDPQFNPARFSADYSRE